MHQSDLNRLNRRLADTRGRNPYGQPVYRWFHSSDHELRYPARIGQSVEWIPQIDESRYLIGMWYPPEPESTWRMMFPDLGYPHQGMYYATDVMLAPGIEPNDTITDQAIGLLKKRDGWTAKDHIEEIQGRRAKRERDERNRQSDLIDNAVTAFGNLPGARGGHVSFGGFDVPILNSKD